MSELTDIFWPTLERYSDAENAQHAAQERDDLDAIASAPFTAEATLLIEEARRLSDADMDRRKTADAKAATYLTVVGVLAPILVSMAPTTWAANQGLVRPTVTVAVFGLALAYLLWSGLWAFRTLEVSASSRVDARDLVAIWSKADAPAGLARGLLDSVRRNRDGVNDKVSKIKMAHAFGWRAFATFVIALMLRAGWEPVIAIWKSLS